MVEKTFRCVLYEKLVKPNRQSYTLFRLFMRMVPLTVHSSFGLIYVEGSNHTAAGNRRSATVDTVNRPPKYKLLLIKPEPTNVPCSGILQNNVLTNWYLPLNRKVKSS